MNLKVFCDILPNRLLEHNGWGATEEICFSEKPGSYFHLSSYKISESDVVFIDANDENFALASEKLLAKNAVVGFDSEFAASWNKLDEDGGGIAVLQLATSTSIFIFDALKLLSGNDQSTRDAFHDLCKTIFESKDIVKVGHSIATDMTEIAKTFKADKSFDVNELIDIAVINRDIFGLANTASLKFMAQKLLGLNLSKYEQVSNWNRRPLRKTQLHYAAIDAFIVVKLYEKLQDIVASGAPLKSTSVSFNR